MRHASLAISFAVVILALALSGCAGPTAATHVAAIPFKSHDISGRTLPARFTCDGQNIAPSFEWGTVPAGTSTLVLLALGLKPVGTGGQYAVSVDWGLAGINPQLHKLAAGQVPAGAYLGRDSKGRAKYSICPSRGATETYQFEIYAAPDTVVLAPGIEDQVILAQLASARSAGSAIGQGAFIVTYTRR